MRVCWCPQNHTQLTAIYLQRSRSFTPLCLTSTSSLRWLCASERELVNGSQNNLLGYCRVSEVRSCVNREVGLGSHSISHSTTPSLINHTVSVDVKHYERKITTETREDSVWLPMWRENKQDYVKNGHTRNPLTLWNSSVNSQLHNYTGILHILHSVHLGNAATTALQFHHVMFVLLSVTLMLAMLFI